ncbi:metal cation symporter ZIP8 [Halyomorpha halys]|uniref:metal cation symporter ZIP8 n=1 Tax=Halyomorpha halys TaxID=286706 RepID=UPI0006D4F5E6|nr:zinc transporter ZIP8 [Halyomorpha halys]
MAFRTILCLFIVFGAGACAVVPTSTLLKVASCSSVNSSRTLCLTSNNCSGREAKESCMLVLSVPPEVEKQSLQQVVGDQGHVSQLEVERQALQVAAERQEGKLSLFKVWGFGCLSVGIISLSGVTGAVLWPIINSPLYNQLMAALIGLATGSLTSTALFQLIPEAFALKEITQSDDYLHTSLFAWFSLWSMFVIEGLSKIAFKKTKGKVSLKSNGAVEETMQLKEAEHQAVHDQGIKSEKKIGAVAWMIILGDGLHNFIDGMSIGAGYSQSLGTGVGLSVAIACEEFPHELGDFAILLQSGLPLKKALLYNFLSACTAFIGLFLGILLGQLEGAHLVFAFAGGLFLYISLSHLIPELKGTVKERLRKSKGEATIFFLLQNIGIITGTSIIYVITKYNDAITNAL